MRDWVLPAWCLVGLSERKPGRTPPVRCDQGVPGEARLSLRLSTMTQRPHISSSCLDTIYRSSEREVHAYVKGQNKIMTNTVLISDLKQQRTILFITILKRHQKMSLILYVGPLLVLSLKPFLLSPYVCICVRARMCVRVRALECEAVGSHPVTALPSPR